MTAELTIRSVRDVGSYQIVTDSHGVEYATRNVLHVSLAKQYQKEQCAVRLSSNAGGRWRNLNGIQRQQSICAWCNKVVRQGFEPATHGMCADCEARELRGEQWSPENIAAPSVAETERALEPPVRQLRDERSNPGARYLVMSPRYGALEKNPALGTMSWCHDGKFATPMLKEKAEWFAEILRAREVERAFHAPDALVRPDPFKRDKQDIGIAFVDYTEWWKD